MVQLVVGVFMALTTSLLIRLDRKANRIMASEQNLSDDLDVIAAKVIEIADEIKALKNQLGPVTQEQLDALDAKAQAIAAALDAAK